MEVLKIHRKTYTQREVLSLVINNVSSVKYNETMPPPKHTKKWSEPEKEQAKREKLGGKICKPYT